MKYHPHPFGWLPSKNEISAREDVEKREPLCTIGLATIENSMEVPQKVQSRSYNKAVLLLGIYTKEMKTLT